MSNIVNEGIKEDILEQIQDDHGFSTIVPFNIEDYKANLRNTIANLEFFPNLKEWSWQELENWIVQDTFEKMGYE
jgi:hypothetical protein